MPDMIAVVREPLPQPPLSISHLMLWTLGTAVILTLYRLLNSISERPPVPNGYDQAWQVLWSFLYGAELVAVVVFASRLIRCNGPLPFHPGHWLLLIGGLTTLMSLFCWGLLVMLDSQAGVGLGMFWFGAYTAIVNSFILALWLVALIRLPSERHWRWFFAGRIVLAAMSVWAGAMILVVDRTRPYSQFPFFQWSSAIQTWIVGPFILIGLPLLLFVDRMSGRKRDWLHFAGVWFFFAASLLALANYIVRAFILPSLVK